VVISQDFLETKLAAGSNILTARFRCDANSSIDSSSASVFSITGGHLQFPFTQARSSTRGSHFRRRTRGMKNGVTLAQAASECAIGCRVLSIRSQPWNPRSSRPASGCREIRTPLRSCWCGVPRPPDWACANVRIFFWLQVFVGGEAARTCDSSGARRRTSRSARTHTRKHGAGSYPNVSMSRAKWMLGSLGSLAVSRSCRAPPRFDRRSRSFM